MQLSVEAEQSLWSEQSCLETWNFSGSLIYHTQFSNVVRSLQTTQVLQTDIHISLILYGFRHSNSHSWIGQYILFYQWQLNSIIYI